MADTQSEEKVQEPVNSSSSPPTKVGLISRRNYICIVSAILFTSFFLPWTQIMGANISGLDIQKNFESYRLVWLLPATATLTFILSGAGQKTEIMRQVAGVIPFGIAIYSYQKFGNDFWKIVAPGGWLALAAGAGLLFLSKPKTKE